MTYRYAFLCALVIAVTGCEPEELIANSRVDRWCGDHPCGWEVDGTIERVGTWHTNEYAVELISGDARLSQLNTIISSDNTECLAFSLLARVEGGAKAYLELDFLDDGVIDFSERLPAGDFVPVSFVVTPPTWFEGLRFTIRKEGAGQVTVARLRATETSACPEAPLELFDRPSGASCENDDQCEVGRCASGECADCVQDDDCDGEQVCGTVVSSGVLSGFGHLDRSCIAPASNAIGDLCDDANQCASGLCCEGVCSECCEGEAECDGEASCSIGETPENPQPTFTDAAEPLMPHRCDPQSGQLEPGDYCLTDDDCASGVCTVSWPLVCIDVTCSNTECEELVCAAIVTDGGECE